MADDKMVQTAINMIRTLSMEAAAWNEEA